MQHRDKLCLYDYFEGTCPYPYLVKGSISATMHVCCSANSGNSIYRYTRIWLPYIFLGSVMMTN